MSNPVDWQWWYGQDEERWEGPYGSREEAIQGGRQEYMGEGFSVMEAAQGNYHFRLDADTILESIDAINEDLQNPEGDGATHLITPEQTKQLALMVNDAIAEWIIRYEINTRAWSFVQQKRAEYIPEE